jgi:hypothetical protein
MIVLVVMVNMEIALDLTFVRVLTTTGERAVLRDAPANTDSAAVVRL